MKERIGRYTNKMASELEIKFPGHDKIVKNYSQAWQDVFILTALNGKLNGKYLEIGAQHSSIKNNTYLLEKQYGWTGVSVEIDPQHYQDWKTNRNNPLILADALLLDYSKVLSKYNFPSEIDYLQLDIEPADNTFEVLHMIPFDKYRFKVITYEHDLYAGGNGPKLQIESREYLKSLGYKMVVGNVCNQPGKPFEDWWVAEEIVGDLKIIEDYGIPAAHYFLNK